MNILSYQGYIKESTESLHKNIDDKISKIQTKLNKLINSKKRIDSDYSSIQLFVKEHFLDKPEYINSKTTSIEDNITYSIIFKDLSRDGFYLSTKQFIEDVKNEIESLKLLYIRVDHLNHNFEDYCLLRFSLGDVDNRSGSNNIQDNYYAEDENGENEYNEDEDEDIYEDDEDDDSEDDDIL